MNQTIRLRIEQIKRGEIPEGYEKTPFGIFPCDWENSKKFETICFINPKTEKLPDEFIYIDLESVVKGKLVTKKTISRYGAPSRAQRVLYNGDVIYQMVRPYQKNNYILNKDIADDNIYVASTGYAQLRSNCNSFIYQLINSNYFCDQVLEKCTGTNYPAISSEDLGKVMVCYPSYQKEQEKIAEILQEQDCLIELKEKLIEEKKKQKQHLMKILLTGKVRLPGFTDEWKDGLFGELIDDCNDGATPPRNIVKYFCGRINWIVTDDIKRYIYSSEEKLTEEAVAKTSLKIWQEGTIILSTCATIGVVGILKCKATTKQGITAISLKDKNCNEYVRYWLNLNTELLNTYAQGSSIREIRVDKLRQIKIRYPSNNEQLAIAEVLSKADDELELLQKELEEQKRKKQSLMQLLLTGIVKVKA